MIKSEGVMNVSEAFWLVASGIVLVLLVAVTFAMRASPRQAASSTRTNQAAWIAASATSLFVLAGIAMTVTGLERSVTIVDVLALAISGIVTGVVLTRGFAFRSR